MKKVHEAVHSIAAGEGGLKQATRKLAAMYGRNSVLEAASDLSFSSREPRVNDRINRMIAVAESLPPEPMPVRRNFGSLKTQARQHLTLVQREGKKVAQQAGVFARQAKEVAHDTALEAQVKAMQTAFTGLELYCDERGRVQSEAIERIGGALEERKAAKRATRSTVRRNPSAALQGRLMELLSTLFTVKNYAWTAHWNARGANFYSDHLLLERIYEKIDKSIDALGERVLAYTGQAVDYAELTREMARASGMLSVQSGGSVFGHLLTLVRAAQRQSDEIRAMLTRSSDEGSTSGLDNYLTDLNDRLDTFAYLLKQRGQE